MSLERSFSDIAREYGISEHGVRGIFGSRYTECQNGLTPAIDRIGRGYSFDVLRVKPLPAPKKWGIVTGYRSVRRRKSEPPMAEMAMTWSFKMLHTEQHEEVKVPERRQVTWGVDLSRLADWQEEERTGQAPGGAGMPPASSAGVSG